MRVSELAKTLNITSTELLSKLKQLKIAAKSTSSTLDADSINRARKALASRAPAKKPAAANVAVRAKPAAAAKKPLTAVKPAPRTVAPAAAKPMTPPSSPVRPAEAPPQPSPRPPVAAGRPAPVAAAAMRPTPAGATAVAPGPKLKTAKPPALPKAKPQSAPPVVEPAVAAAPVGPPKQLEVRFPVTVKDLAAKMDVKASDVIKYLMQRGIFASIVQPLDEPTAAGVAKVSRW